MTGNWNHEGNTTERGYGWAWQQLRRVALERDGYLCRTCYAKGRPTPATEVDHITPKAQDGEDDIDNLQSLCSDCHRAKTAKENGKRETLKFDSRGFPIW